MDPNELLEVIDRTIASARAAQAAGADPAQAPERITELSGRAGADIARLPTREVHEEQTNVPMGVFDALRQAQAAANEGDLVAAERHLVAAREQIGGPSS